MGKIIKAGQVQVVNGIDIGSGVFGGGIEFVANGGVAIDTMIDLGGNQFILSGGKAYDAMVNYGGMQAVGAGGKAFSTLVNEGGQQVVAYNGETDFAIINGGSQYLKGVSFFSELKYGGTETVATGRLRHNGACRNLQGSVTIPTHESQITCAVMTLPLQRPYLASYCLIQVNDAILLQRRFNTGYLDGQWALPSGHVVDGEDALSAASRELLEETSLVVQPDDWRFVCAMHRRTDRTIVDLFFTTNKFCGTPRICESTKCDGLAFFRMNELPHPLAGYIGVALDCLKGVSPHHGRYHGEGWS